ncbi:SipW-dependent-type signal peptide-containing protein [Haladaptatus sp. DFWS20]|uniref:SipW-dependent-type signal peptide-containing protein n=1 Tax=Haladaptatus sp. DFWS20 TaxID=3403467 RepID=UPI003EBBF6E8
MSDKKPNLTRRKALLGLGGIGAGAAFGGAGTMAWLNDKEISRNNTVTAGKLDLKVDR